MFKSIVCFLMPKSRLKNIILGFLSKGDWTIKGTASIGHSYLDIKRLYLDENSRIGHFNKITNMKSVQLGRNSIICRSNTIFGLRATIGDGGVFEVGAGSQILKRVLIDCTEPVTIGDNVVFGGISTNIWTHSFNREGLKSSGPVSILNNVYIGSNVSISQGVVISDNTEVGMCSVVVKNLDGNGFFAGNPASKKKSFT